MLNAEQKASLTEAADRYADRISPLALSYLQARGISQQVANSYRLGSVVEPSVGHEHAVGMLSIPYLTPSGVVGIKFRRLDDGTPKYLWPTGQKIGLFNVQDLHKSGCVGIPAVGVAGVSQWKAHFPKLFEPYTRVLIFADNDIKDDGRNPGQELAKRIKEDLPAAIIVGLPGNQDVNDLYLAHGKDWFDERLTA